MSATLLALETATNACSVALLCAGKVHERFEIAPRRHSDLIMAMIDEVLTAATIKLHDVTAIAFGCGPGSFMGVRLATGVAQGLAFGIECPVIAVSTLQTLAQTAYHTTQAENIIVGWDARMAEIYWGAYELNNNGVMAAVIADRLDKPQALHVPADRQWLAAGNAWHIYADELSTSSKQHLHLIDNTTEIYPHAAAMTKIAMEKYRRGEVVSPDKAAPTYLRDKVTQ